MKAARPVRRGADGKVLRVTEVTRRRPTLHVAEPVFLEEPPFTGDTCHLAPAPTLQRPDLLTAVSIRPPDVDCAAALDLTDQDPTINQMMASLVLQVVRRMGGGHLPLYGPLPGHGPGHRNAVLRHPGGGGAAWWGGTTPGERRKQTHPKQARS